MSNIKTPGGDAAHQLDLSQTKPIICKCGNHTFQQVSFLRSLSALVSPNGRDATIPLMAFACNSCGNVPDELVPPFIKAEAQATTSPIVATPVPQASTLKLI